jgi:hypothetical protein
MKNAKKILARRPVLRHPAASVLCDPKINKPSGARNPV